MLNLIFFAFFPCPCLFLFSSARRTLAQRRTALDHAESALRSDESEFAKQVQIFDQRMHDLQLLGARVQSQSSDLAEQSHRLASEKALIEAAKQEARALIEAGEKMRAEVTQFEEQRLNEKKELDKAKMKLLAAQKQLLVDQDRIARELAVAKTIQSFNAALPKHLAPLPRTMAVTAPSSGAGGLGLTPSTYIDELSNNFNTAIGDVGVDHGGWSAPINQPPMMMNSTLPPTPMDVSRQSIASSFHAPTANSNTQSHTPSSTVPQSSFDSDHITAALVALSSHTETMKNFLADEKILTPV